jgi:hypothetical protein
MQIQDMGSGIEKIRIQDKHTGSGTGERDTISMIWLFFTVRPMSETTVLQNYRTSV